MKRKIAFIVCFIFIAATALLWPQMVAAAQIENYYTIDDILDFGSENMTHSTEDGYAVTSVTITDPNVLEGLVNSGAVSLGPNGSLPTTVTIYRYVNQALPQEIADVFLVREMASVTFIEPIIVQDLTIIKSNQRTYTANTFFSEDAVCDGDSLTDSYTGSGTVGWTTSMSSSIEVGGDIVSILEVKGAVSRELGSTIGVTLSFTKEHTTTAPAGKIRYVRAYLNYSGFDYEAQYGLVRIALGDAWTPCGIVFVHADYDYDPSDYFG